MRTANATANAGVLRFAQNDNGFVRAGSAVVAKAKTKRILDCAPHDEAVRRFGRSFFGGVRKTATAEAKATADPCGMTTSKANATTRTTAKAAADFSTAHLTMRL